MNVSEKNHATTSDFSKSVILGNVSFVNSSLEPSVEVLGLRALEGKGGSAFFVNVHTWTMAQDDPDFALVLKNATYCFPDGKPLVWLAHSRGNREVTRICGPDFTPRFLKRWGKSLTWGCVGGTVGQAQELGRRFNVNITEYVAPFRAFSPDAAQEDWNEFLKKFQQEQGAHQFPNVVLICLGAPKQEQWIHEVIKTAPKSVLFLGLGAALDFLTDAKKRAPRWMQNAGLEWLHRLASEPSRLGFRYFESNLKFLKYASRK